MKTILIRRTGSDLQWKELASSSTYFNYFPRDVRTAADMRKFFADGRYTNAPWQSMRDIELRFIDINGESYQHYKVTQAGKFHQAVVNHDDTQKITFTTAELWPAAEQTNYLCGTAIYLPSEFHKDIDGALKYLQENEPFTVKDFEKQLQQKIKDKITERCEQHAQGSASYAQIEFQD